MFDVAPTELLLVAVVALVVIGPKDLPRVMRVVGHWIGKARGVARHFRAGFDEMVRQAELEEMEKRWQAENARIMAEHPAPLPADTPLLEAGADLPDAQPEAHVAAFDPQGLPTSRSAALERAAQPVVIAQTDEVAIDMPAEPAPAKAAKTPRSTRKRTRPAKAAAAPEATVAMGASDTESGLPLFSGSGADGSDA